MNKKVLLVEDEEYIRDLYKRQLELEGLMTDGFGKGQDGLNAAKQNKYDLVLLDIMLPDINGLQILQQLKEDNATKATPVVLLTNLGQDAVIKQGFELGAEGYLVKSAYTPNQIVQEIKNILEKKQAEAGSSPIAAPPTGSPATMPEANSPVQTPVQATPPTPPAPPIEIPNIGVPPPIPPIGNTVPPTEVPPQPVMPPTTPQPTDPSSLTTPSPVVNPLDPTKASS